MDAGCCSRRRELCEIEGCRRANDARANDYGSHPLCFVTKKTKERLPKNDEADSRIGTHEKLLPLKGSRV